VLVINHVYPDDLGTISFEAYNPLGVAVTTALFAVEGTNMVYSAYDAIFNMNQLLFGFVSKILFQMSGAALFMFPKLSRVQSLLISLNPP